MDSKHDNFPSLAGVRVLFLATYPPPFGGIASHLKTLMPDLLKANAEDIAVVSFGEKNLTEKVDGVTVHRLNLKKNLWRTFLPQNLIVLFYVIRSLAGRGLPFAVFIQELVKTVLINEIAKEHRSQVVSAYMANASLPLLPLNRLWKGKRGLVLTVFGEVYDSTSFMEKHKDLIHEVLALPKFVLSSSCHCANSFKKIGSTIPIEAVYYGVELENVTDAEKREKFRKENGFSESDVLVFFMGRMVNDMGLDVVLKTAPELLESESSLKIIIAGATGSLTPKAKELASKYAGRIKVFENVSFGMQRFLYSGTDVLVAPSFNQRACMGVSIKEAMAASLPVIGGAGGGVSEAIIDGENGYLIPIDSSGAVDGKLYAEAVRKLVRQPELRQKMGTAGRLRAENVFSVGITNKRMAEVILSTKQVL